MPVKTLPSSGHNPDGTLDPTLDGDGIATAGISGSTDEARAMVFERAIRIVLAETPFFCRTRTG